MDINIDKAAFLFDLIHYQPIYVNNKGCLERQPLLIVIC